MKNIGCLLFFTAALAGTGSAIAQVERSKIDSRLGYLKFDESRVIDLVVGLNTTTMLVLAKGEKIEFMGSGQNAECEKPEALWCIAEAGNQVWITPRVGARSNNLHIKSETYNYSIAIKVATSKEVPLHRVDFRYPVDLTIGALKPLAPTKGNDQVVLLPAAKEHSAVLNATKPPNLAYTMQVGTASDLIRPIAVSDNHIDTTFVFAKGNPIPAVFRVDGSGNEEVVTRRMDGDRLVVEGVGESFTLRLGARVVRVWRESGEKLERPVGRVLKKVSK